MSYQSACKQCNAEWCRDKYYNGNRKQQCADSRDRRRQVRKDHVVLYKIQHGCSMCGYNTNPYAMDLHHDGNKEDIISHLVRDQASMKLLLAELEKCIVLCARCHRELHHPYDPEGEVVEPPAFQAGD